MNKLGPTIRHARENNNMLLRHLAAEVDIDNAILSKIERGERKPKKELIKKISKALSIEEEELITGSMLNSVGI